MTWGDVGLLLLLVLAVWVVLIEPRTSYRLEDGLRLGAAALRSAWSRVRPGVSWLAYDVIIGRKRDETVKRSQGENAPAARQKAPDARTDGRTDLADVPDLGCRRLQLDRTREALLHTLLYNGWTVTDVRAVLKGENAKIASEVAAAEAQLVGPRYRRSPEEAAQIAERRQELGLN